MGTSQVSPAGPPQKAHTGLQISGCPHKSIRSFLSFGLTLSFLESAADVGHSCTQGSGFKPWLHMCEASRPGTMRTPWGSERYLKILAFISLSGLLPGSGVTHCEPWMWWRPGLRTGGPGTRASASHWLSGHHQ